MESNSDSWKLARDINWHPASATSALSFSLGWEPRGSIWSTAKTTALLRILAFCLDKPCWKESWRAKIVAHWKGNPPSKFDKTVAVSWWFCFGLPAAAWFIALRQLYVGVKHWISPCQVLLCVKCLYKSQQWITMCQAIFIRNVFEWVSRTTWSNRKKIQPLLRYEIQLLRFEATGFWCRWKNQTHKLVYLMGQHWPSLGLLPSGHQCREFGVIQQVSTELLRSFVKRTWETRLITISGAQKKLRKIVWPTWQLKKKEMKLPAKCWSSCHLCSDVVQAWGFAWHDYVVLVVSLPVYRFFRSSFCKRASPTSYMFRMEVFIHIRTYFTHDPSIEFSRNYVWISRPRAWCPSCFGLNWGGGAIFRFLVGFCQWIKLRRFHSN